MNLPLQSACNPDDEVEHILWALVGLTGPSSHAPLVLPMAVMRQWAKHLYDCGFRHHPELQKIMYLPPRGDANWVTGAAGEWVSVDTPLPPEQSAPDTSHLTRDEMLVVFDQLKNTLFPDGDAPDTNFASVSDD